MVVAAFDDGLDGAVDVGALIHDHRSSSAVFQSASRPRGKLPTQIPPDTRGADEAEKRNSRVRRQSLRQVIVRGDKRLAPMIRQSRLTEQLYELQTTKRGSCRGLNDDRTSDRDR